MRTFVVVLAFGASCRYGFDEVASSDGASPDAAISPDAACEQLCGPSGTASCCASVTIPGGSFLRSYDTAADQMFSDASNPATVGAFQLDTYEVTVARFRRFVEAGAGTQLAPPTDGAGAHAAIANSGWNPTWTASLPADTATLVASAQCNTYATWTDAPAGNEVLPMNCVSWYVALAFCIWDGGYLPTEAEWNFAAAGGDEQRAFPWSAPSSDTTLDCAHADFQGCGAGLSSEGLLAGLGRWGNADLSGNVWEWVLDSNGAYPNPCVDCAANPVVAGQRVVRGGSFVSTAPNLRTADRFQYAAAAHNDNVGFRCARAP